MEVLNKNQAYQTFVSKIKNPIKLWDFLLVAMIFIGNNYSNISSPNLVLISTLVTVISNV